MLLARMQCRQEKKTETEKFKDMKRIFYIMGASLTALMLMQGCKTEKIEYDSIDGTSEEDTGYLNLGSFDLQVASYAEEITSSSSGPASKAGEEPETDFGSTSEASDDYVIRLRNIKTSAEQTMTYGELKQMENQQIPLTPGTYIVSAESHGYAEYAAEELAADWEKPVYYGETTAVVVSKKETEVSGLVCRLANLKATVSVTPDLAGLFMSDAACTEQGMQKLSISLAVNESSLLYGRQEMESSKAGYFKTDDQTVTLDLVLKGQYNKAAADETPEYIDINWKSSIRGCKAGQWRKISIGVDNAHDGNVQFEVTVENWVYDEKVEVDVSSLYAFAEETVPDVDVSDANSPVLALTEGNINDGYTLNSGMYDDMLGKWSENMRLTLAPAAGASVVSVDVEIAGSDNEDFLKAVDALGVMNKTVNIYPDISALSSVLAVSEKSGILSFALNDSGMSKLFSYKGMHHLKVVARDNAFRTSYTDFRIVCMEGDAAAGAPEIEWTNSDGTVTYDFEKEYVIDDELQVVLNISTESQFTGFNVEIISDLLTPEELKKVGLSDKFDLLNPGEFKETLEGFGFPLGDSISSNKDVKFEISQTFLELIKILGTGYCNFKLVVTDDSGTTEKTVKLKTA